MGTSIVTLANAIYGSAEISLTGLYSFEFVNEKRSTIAEVFFMTPPKSKTVSEPTRSSTVPTFSGNNIIDGGNGTKNITLSGELYFPDIANPDKPQRSLAQTEDLTGALSGFDEFFKLRWMLIRYRDYTMTDNASVDIPVILQGNDQIQKLYKKVAKNVKDKVGSLYDQIRLIFHDYDMGDHWYCRVANFTSDQSGDKPLLASYTINIECDKPDYGQKGENIFYKKSTNEEIDENVSVLTT